MASDTRTPSVSVLIVCFNEATWIEACLDSLIANDYPRERIEFVVIDGGSDDGTVDIVERIAAAAGNVRLVHNEARLKPHGLNLGIRETT